MAVTRPPHRSVLALLTQTVLTLDVLTQSAPPDTDAGSQLLESDVRATPEIVPTSSGFVDSADEVAHRLLQPIRPFRLRIATGSLGSRAQSFHACLGSPTPQCLCRARDLALATVLPSGSPDTVGPSDFGFFGAHQLQGYSAYMCPDTNASSAALPTALTSSGSGWFAIPFLCDSFIHYFIPVYPDAIQAKLPGPPVAHTDHQLAS